LNLKKDERVRNKNLVVTWREYEGGTLGTEMAHFLVSCTLPVTVLCGLIAGFEF
jgi:hypothetical protein